MTFIKIDRLTEEEVQALVKRLLAGDESTIPQIAQSYIPLALSISRVYGYKNPQRKSDIDASALHGLTQAVTWFPKRAYNTNITPYLHKTIHRFIRDYIERDHTVPIPRKSFKKAEAEGKILVSYSTSLMAMSDSTDIDNPMMGVDKLQYEYDIPDIHYSEMDFENLYEAMDLTDMERKVLNLLMEGHNTYKIAPIVHMSRSWVTKIVGLLRVKCVKIGLCQEKDTFSKIPVKRECKRCKEEKSLSDFACKDRGTRYNTVCKECVKARRK